MRGRTTPPYHRLLNRIIALQRVRASASSSLPLGSLFFCRYNLHRSVSDFVLVLVLVCIMYVRACGCSSSD